MSIYVELTQEFNHGRLRAILASGRPWSSTVSPS